MAFVEINPRYRHLLSSQGLDRPERFFDLPSVIVSGHPDRNVARVTLGPFPHEIAAFLKREHRVRWKDRVFNFCAGFGFVSKSQREALTLEALKHSAIACPEWIAYGEDDAGKAFLLLRALCDARDLRIHLRESRSDVRRRFVNRLGQTLAAMHNAGFDHPDLYSKHILVDRENSIYFLDWQRSRPHPIGWRERWRDLAALSATLSEDLLHRTERALCLRAYLRACRLDPAVHNVGLLQSAFHILRREKALLERRRIRELRQLPVAPGKQSLVWADGEALCMTQSFQAELAGQVPDWLRLASMPASADYLGEIKSLSSSRVAWLVRRRTSLSPGTMIAWLLRREPVSPELSQAALLFRLERHGIAAPKLLAFGQRSWGPRRQESFILMEIPADARELGDWLRETPPSVLGSTLRERRRQVIRQSGALARLLHDATVFLDHGQLAAEGYAMGDQRGLLFVQEQADGVLVLCGAVGALAIRRRGLRRHPRTDLAFLREHYAAALASRTDELRFLLCYLGIPRLTPAARLLARTLSKSNRRPPATQFPKPLPSRSTAPQPRRKAVA